MSGKQLVGQALGGAIGSSMGESLFPMTSTPLINNGPPLTPMSQLPPLSHYIGGGSGSSSGAIPFGTLRRPPISYRPGIDPQFGYFAP